MSAKDRMALQENLLKEREDRLTAMTRDMKKVEEELGVLDEELEELKVEESEGRSDYQKVLVEKKKLEKEIMEAQMSLEDSHNNEDQIDRRMFE